MKLNERIVSDWGDSPFRNQLALIHSHVSDLGVALRVKICKELDWTDVDYFTKLGQKEPLTDEEIEVITTFFFKEWVKLGTRVAKRVRLVK